MARYPASLEQLITAFTSLPGVGRKTAERYVTHLLKQPPEVVGQLITTLQAAQKTVHLCTLCFNFATDGLCDICKSSQRDQMVVCVVSDSAAVTALEQAGTYQGTYHVLGGTINQLEGMGPDQLHLQELVSRVNDNTVNEVILGTNPDMTGEATALYVIDALKPTGVLITRLARGLAS
ncbi:MAG TPA: recombination protein RecR, partial [Candidatus Kerfeldbacteria bacterium]|nr:recombination protein RecR [Candidatus Kerfeldbacteria bacterium]